MQTKTRTRNESEAAPAPPVVIHDTGVYTAAQVRALLGLGASTLRREVRLGRLKVCKRAGKYFVLGSQLLDWLRGGEIAPRRPAPSDNDASR